MIEKTFSKKEQLDKDGKIIDYIFEITETETKTTKRTRTLSSSEVEQETKAVEALLNMKKEEIKKLEEELNFLKTLR